MQIFLDIWCQSDVHLLHSMPSGHIFPCTGGRLGHTVCRHRHALALQSVCGCRVQDKVGGRSLAHRILRLHAVPLPPCPPWSIPSKAYEPYARLQSSHTVAIVNLVGTSTHPSPQAYTTPSSCRAPIAPVLPVRRPHGAGKE